MINRTVPLFRYTLQLPPPGSKPFDRYSGKVIPGSVICREGHLAYLGCEINLTLANVIDMIIYHDPRAKEAAVHVVVEDDLDPLKAKKENVEVESEIQEDRMGHKTIIFYAEHVVPSQAEIFTPKIPAEPAAVS